MIETATMVQIIPTKICIEYDMMGSRHIVLQHEGCEPHTMASVFYDYRYTSNSHIQQLANDIALMLGAESPVENVYRKGEKMTKEQCLEHIQMLNEILPTLE